MHDVDPNLPITAVTTQTDQIENRRGTSNGEMSEAKARVGACCDAFAFLVAQCGFAEPEIEAIGREQFVRFHRADSTVSIAWEPGLSPIVELFYPPTNPTERPVSWADRNGVARCRRIPRLRFAVSYDDTDPESFAAYVRAQAASLAQVEHAWLTGPG